MYCRLVFLMLGLALLLGFQATADPPKTNVHQPKPQVQPQVDCFGDPLPQGAMARLGTTRFRHGFTTRQVAFAPNGKVLASVGRFGGCLCLWDAATGRLLHRLRMPAYANSLAFSASGNLLVVGSDPPILIEVATAKKLRRFALPEDYFAQAVALSPHGRTVAAGVYRQGGGVVMLWDAATGKELHRLEGHTDDDILAVAFAGPEGKVLASASPDKTVRLWDVATGKELRQLVAHKSGVRTLALTPDGKLLASVCDDPIIRLWDVASGQLVRQLKDPEGNFAAVTFAADGKRLASMGNSGTIRIWDSATGNELRRWNTDTPRVGGLAFAPDGKVLASTGQACVRLWDTNTGKEIAPWMAHSAAVLALRWAADGQTVFSHGLDRKVLEWDVANGGERGRLCREPLGQPGSRGQFGGEFLSPDGKVVAQVSGKPPKEKPGSVIRLWDTRTGKELRVLQGHRERIQILSFSSNSQLLASADKEGVRLWDLTTGTERYHWSKQRSDGATLAFSADGSLLISRESDGMVRLWEVATGKERLHWRSPAGAVRTVAFSPESQLLAAVTEDGIRVWNVSTGAELARFDVPSRIFSLALSPRGRLLAVATIDFRRLPNGDSEDVCTLHLREVISGQELQSLETPQGIVFALSFAPDGRALASGGGDGSVLLWDLTGTVPTARSQPRMLTEGDLKGLWSALRGQAPQAHQAIWAFVRAAPQSMSFLKEHLQPAAPAAARQIAKLVTQLGSKNFAEREQAAKRLHDLGEAAEAALRKMLTGNPTLEVRRRVEQILAKRHPEMLRQLRALEVLEYLATPEARQALELLAKGTPNPQVAQAANAALKRLDQR